MLMPVLRAHSPLVPRGLHEWYQHDNCMGIRVGSAGGRQTLPSPQFLCQLRSCNALASSSSVWGSGQKDHSLETDPGNSGKGPE